MAFWIASLYFTKLCLQPLQGRYISLHMILSCFIWSRVLQTKAGQCRVKDHFGSAILKLNIDIVNSKVYVFYCIVKGSLLIVSADLRLHLMRYV